MAIQSSRPVREQGGHPWLLWGRTQGTLDLAKDFRSKNGIGRASSNGRTHAEGKRGGLFNCLTKVPVKHADPLLG
jgi:hypothetical protein